MRIVGIKRLFGILYSLIFVILSFLVIPKKKVIIFGGAPIIKFSRWAKALKKIGHNSVSLVPSVYRINKVTDFDYLWIDLVPSFLKPRQVRKLMAPGFALIWLIRNARVICCPVGGITFLNWLGLEQLEYWLLKFKGIKSVIITGGGDAYMLGLIHDKALRVALQGSYPDRSRLHRKTLKSVRFWEEKADLFITSQMFLDGFARSDLLTPHMGCLPSQDRPVKSSTKKIKIVHAPNHRLFKGTETILDAIHDLESNGYVFEFKLLERMNNYEVLRELETAHIAIDQLIMPGYSNFAIECLSLGVPTLANVESEPFRSIMNHYSFMENCPIVHADSTNIYRTLEDLLQNHRKLEVLSNQSLEYFYERHSEASWQNLWGYFEKNNFHGDLIASYPYAGKNYQKALNVKNQY